MIRDLGTYVPKRAYKLNAPILTMLLNGLHDRHQGRVFVLQVGAGAGEGTLPLLPRFQIDGWSGLLIEPHPQNFSQLEALHQDSERIAILNLGISDISANLKLHSLTPEAEARYRRGPRGRASLIRDRIAREGAAAEDLLETEVPVLRLDTVLEELGLDAAQLVVINAGGHEAQVLAGFDLSTLNASLVFIHSTPGTVSEEACLATLADAGFLPFLVADWLVGLAPDQLAVPMEELLSFFQKGVGATQTDEE